jgi:hypothetical protein
LHQRVSVSVEVDVIADFGLGMVSSHVRQTLEERC